MKGNALWFESIRTAVVREEEVAEPGQDEVTVRGITSLVSPGTELQVYRGEISPETDLGLETCRGSFAFPVKYAYQLVGEVVASGEGVPLQPGERVFARHPHQDLFTMRYNPDLIFALPEELDPEIATFSNLADVALNAILDCPIRIGDVVVSFGYGIVGAFCAQFAGLTAGQLIVVDPLPQRRALAIANGAHQAVAPEDAVEAVMEATNGRGADVAIEVSSSTQALQTAIEVTGQEGTILTVSYYGSRPVTLTLAPEFHFRRVRIVSSQVSSVGSGLQPRWDFPRRFDVVLSRLGELNVESMISHRFSLADAPEAYRLIDQSPGETFGVILQYGGSST
jgi:threonine dehydrogenase-like Zn-dependent dehydrogenase